MEKLKNVLITMLAPILWGSTYIITTALIPIDRPIFVAFMRGFPIGLLLLLYFRKFPKGKWLFRSFVLGTLNIGLFFLVLFIAAYRLPGGIAAVIGSIQPILILLLSFFAFKEKPAKNAYVAIVLTILGVSLLILKSKVSFDFIGIIAAVLGAVVMAAGVVLTKYWGRPKDVSQLAFTGWQLFFGSLILIPIQLIFEKPIPHLNAINLFGLAVLGIFNTGLAYFVWFRGIERLSPAKVSFLTPVNPLTAIALGYFILGQKITILQLFGVVLILLSVVISQKK